MCNFKIAWCFFAWVLAGGHFNFWFKNCNFDFIYSILTQEERFLWRINFKILEKKTQFFPPIILNKNRTYCPVEFCFVIFLQPQIQSYMRGWISNETKKFWQILNKKIKFLILYRFRGSDLAIAVVQNSLMLTTYPICSQDAPCAHNMPHVITTWPVCS